MSASSKSTTGVLGDAPGFSTDGILGASGSTLTPDITFSPDTVAEDGGWAIGAVGLFTTAKAYNVWLIDGDGVEYPCYSGVVSNGNNVVSLDGTSIRFVSPPVPPGTHAVRITAADLTETVTILNAVTAVKQSFSNVLYSLRAGQPYPRYPGVFNIKDERF